MNRPSIPFISISAASLLLASPAHAALDDMLVAGGLGLSAGIGMAGFATGLWALLLLRKARREQRRLMEMVERTLAAQTRSANRAEPAEGRLDPPMPANITAAVPAQNPDGGTVGDGASEGAQRAAAADEPAANVIRLSEEAARAARPEREERTSRRAGKAEKARVEALCEGRFDLALEPMISISGSRAVGFNVHATVGPGNDFMSRMASEPRAGARQAFEAALVLKAAEVASRHLGADGANLPLHVPVSASLLQNPEALGGVATLYKGDDALARSLILSLPVHLMTGANRKHAAALDTLRDSGAQFAAEGWLGGADALKILTGYGVRCVKLTANRLLEREKLRPRDLDAESIIAACTREGVTVSAIDVTTDEEAVSLIDLGVDVMSGSRFNGPRRLKPDLPAGKGILAAT